MPTFVRSGSYAVILTFFCFVTACAGGSSSFRPESKVHLKVLAINDFHGQLVKGKKVGDRPVGSAPVLASYLKGAMRGVEERTLLLHAGDLVGGSPPESALLQDEPSIMFMNLFANEFCRRDRLHPRCNMAATVGNHEFDEGVSEMLRLINGGNHTKGPFLQDPYLGAHYPHVSANVVDGLTGAPLLSPYVLKEIDGVPVAIVGATLRETPSHVAPAAVVGVRFLDEAASINAAIDELRQRQVRAVIVLLHKGGHQNPPRKGEPAGEVSGEIVDIIARLDSEADLVISGDTHSFTNTLMANAAGKEILVTQAYSAGSAYADIDLQIDRATKDVVAKNAAIVTTYADRGPGLTPDRGAAALVAAAEEKTGPLLRQKVGVAGNDMSRKKNRAGESPLGSFIADAQRFATAADFAFVNSGGIRANLDAGEVTWGELFAVQPFGNDLVVLELTGAQIYRLLEQQWQNQPEPRMLQVSGLTYTWNPANEGCHMVTGIRKEGVPLQRDETYTVAANSFLAGGGDNFSVFAEGRRVRIATSELEALVKYIESLPQPFMAPVEGRIVKGSF